jgi:hypothetical protein
MSITLKRPAGVTIIAILMFAGGVFVALLPGPLYYRGIGTIGESWRFALSLLDIAIGIGLLMRSGWARLATIAVATLSIGLSIVALCSGLQHMRAIDVFSHLVTLPIDGFIVWYLLTPEIGRVFARNHETLKISP